MSIEIRFRGVFLFNPRSPDGPEIVIPNAEFPPSAPGSDTWTHVDDDIANRHYSRMQVYQVGGTTEEPKMRENLLGRTVTIVGPKVSAFELDPNIARVVPINEVTNVVGWTDNLKVIAPGAKEFWRRAATRVRLHAGRLSVKSFSDNKWSFQKNFNANHSHQAAIKLPLELSLEIETAAVTITLDDHLSGGKQKEVKLDQQHPLAIIYNFDMEWPSLEQLDEEGTSPVNVDVDYKWIYQLLRSSDDDLNRWRKNRWLPAPQLGSASGDSRAESVRVSSCFFARWA